MVTRRFMFYRCDRCFKEQQVNEGEVGAKNPLMELEVKVQGDRGADLKPAIKTWELCVKCYHAAVKELKERMVAPLGNLDRPRDLRVTRLPKKKIAKKAKKKATRKKRKAKR